MAAVLASDEARTALRVNGSVGTPGISDHACTISGSLLHCWSVGSVGRLRSWMGGGRGCVRRDGKRADRGWATPGRVGRRRREAEAYVCEGAGAYGQQARGITHTAVARARGIRTEWRTYSSAGLHQH